MNSIDFFSYARNNSAPSSSACFLFCIIFSPFCACLCPFWVWQPTRQCKIISEYKDKYYFSLLIASEYVVMLFLSLWSLWSTYYTLCSAFDVKIGIWKKRDSKGNKCSFLKSFRIFWNNRYRWVTKRIKKGAWRGFSYGESYR